VIAVKFSGLALWLCKKASRASALGALSDRAYQANL
jgi:hypothetical protein